MAVHPMKTLLVLMVSALLFRLGQPRELDVNELRTLSSDFRFERHALPVIEVGEPRDIRPVHPSLSHIAAWISSVGGAVALADVDSDGMSNDVIYVDTRRDIVIVSPAKGASGRFAPFTLNAGPLFDRDCMAPMGCLPGDFNEDGTADLLVYYWGRTPIAFLNQRAPTSTATVQSADFLPCPVKSGGERWYTNAMTQADVDGDGHIDLVVGNYFPDGARVLDAMGTGREQMQSSMSRAFNGGNNRVLLWSSADSQFVAFREAADAFHNTPETETAWTLAVGAADIDGDLRPELYFANDFGPDRLLYNRSEPGNVRFELLTGTRTLTTPASKVLGHDSFKGMGVDFGDINQDGHLDIFVSNIAEEYALEESHFLFLSSGKPIEGRKAPFVDASEKLGVSRSGWGWDTRFGDFNNDGQLEALQATGFIRGSHNCWPELHETAMGNDLLIANPLMWHRFRSNADISGRSPNVFFARASDGQFHDIAAPVGFGQPQVSRAMATGDIDGDGDLDIAVGNQWTDSYLYVNESPNRKNFLGLRLLLTQSKSLEPQVLSGLPALTVRARPAIGAVARFEAEGIRYIAQVDGGNGHSGVRSSDLHFGLGDTSGPVVVSLRWRDGRGKPQATTLRLLAGWHTILLH